MKKRSLLLLAALLPISVLSEFSWAAAEAPGVCEDGRARPSVCGRLQVADGKLCDEHGEPVMLRGVSLNGLLTGEKYLDPELFRELARERGVNLVRLAMYTYGTGSVGYCTGGDKERHKEDIALGVDCTRQADLYVLIDWHILSDGDPNSYLEEADAWIELLEEEKISWCMWSFSAAPEPCSALRSSVLKHSGFTEEDFNATGRWLLDTLQKYAGR